MNIPQQFKIFPSWGYKRQRVKISDDMQEIKKEIKHFVDVVYNPEFDDKDLWSAEDKLDELHEKLNKIKKKKFYLSKLIKEHEDLESGARTEPIEISSFDIEEIKKVPIDRIVKVNRAGFFKLRDEKTPSVKWYKDKNRWYDFGSARGGDVIDVYMKLNNCDFITACKELQCII